LISSVLTLEVAECALLTWPWMAERDSFSLLMVSLSAFLSSSLGSFAAHAFSWSPSAFLVSSTLLVKAAFSASSCAGVTPGATRAVVTGAAYHDGLSAFFHQSSSACLSFASSRCTVSALLLRADPRSGGGATPVLWGSSRWGHWPALYMGLALRFAAALFIA